MKFIHVSDTHLGCKAPLEYSSIREKDFLYAFRQVIDIAVDKNVDFIIHTGDFFDERYAIPHSILIEIIKQLIRLKEKKIPLYVIRGNHDLKKTNGQLLKMLDMLGLLILLEPGKEKIINEEQNYLIYGVSEPRDVAKDHIALYYKIKFSKISEKGDYFKIFMSHTVPKEFGFPYNDPHILPINLYPQEFDYYAFGHIHYPILKEIDGKYYILPGSTERCEISEKESKDKGIILFNNGKIEFLKLRTRPTKIVDLAILNERNIELLRRELLNTDRNAIIKIKVTVNSKTKDQVRKIVAEYRSLGGLIIYEEFEKSYGEIVTNNDIKKSKTFEELLVTSIRNEILKIEKNSPRELEDFIFEILELYDMLSKEGLKKKLLSKYQIPEIMGYSKKQKTLFDLWV